MYVQITSQFLAFVGDLHLRLAAAETDVPAAEVPSLFGREMLARLTR